VIGHRLLVPALVEFMRRHRALAVELTLEDHYVNLIEEGIDLAIRIGHPGESGLIARKLAPVPQVVCGAPAYFERRGRPASPADLVNHEWVLYSLLSPPDRFTFVKEGSRLPVRVAGRLRANGGPAIREALLAGQGITLIPRFYVEEDLDRGRLEVVLAEYEVKPSSLYAVFPHRDPSSKVRLFVDALSRHLARRDAAGC
jgi:DNA-binding transcriptional LysR family regulator